MKIAYITDGIFPYVVGGMQVVSRKHIEGLAERGNDLVVVHTFRRGTVRQTDLPGKVIPLDWPYPRGLSCWSPWHYAAELKRYSRDVDGIICDEKPDVVYAEGPLVYQTLRRSDRCPVLFHPHGLDMFQNQMSLVRNLRTNMLKPLFSFHARRSDRVISQGGKLTRILTEVIGTPEHRIRVLPNSVGSVHANAIKRRVHSPLRCLFVGRNDPKKGIRLLLDAVRRTRGVTLDVVGIRSPRHEKGVRPHLPQMGSDPFSLPTWHGTVDDPDRVAKFYQDCDVLLLPSYSEGMATVLLEAMSWGMPCIATDVGATSELVVTGRTGWLTAAGDAAGLARAIESAKRSSPGEFERLSSRCIQHVRDRFLDREVCDGLHDLLIEATVSTGTVRRELSAA